MVININGKKLDAVILYLSRRQDIQNLKKSLKLLYKFFNKKFKYPVLIFHDDFTKQEENSLLKINKNIKFENVEFKIPPWIDQNKSFKTDFSMGYRHMCRFFSGELYKNDAIKNYDWYWRLDSDSFIHSDINYDIFNFMDKKGFIYGYLGQVLKDIPNAVEGLWDLTKRYIQIHNIKPKFLQKYLDNNGSWDRSLYYTNFEVSKLDFWRSDEYMKYYNYIDQNGGIYYNRWGDHVIHFLALSIFIDENKIYCFKDIDYSHQSFRPNKKKSFKLF